MGNQLKKATMVTSIVAGALFTTTVLGPRLPMPMQRPQVNRLRKRNQRQQVLHLLLKKHKRPSIPHKRMLIQPIYH